MRLRACLILLITLLTPLPAHAQLSRADLASVGFIDRRGAALPAATLERLDGGRAELRDVLAQRPALLLLVDYTCETLCGITLGALSDALEAMPLTIAHDYRVLVIGFDPNDEAAEIEAFRSTRLAQSPFIANFEFLRGSRAAMTALTDAVGFTSKYDRARDQFAHPAAVIVTTPDGRVSRTLDALALTPLNLRLALTEAGEGRTGTLADHFTLLCYGWDAATGIYTLQIRRLLMIGGLATVLLLLSGVGFLHYRERLALRRPHDE